MSTRSYIGIEHEDGTITAIYCHFDGYESGVGAVLLDYYNNKKIVMDLIALGDISSLGTTLIPDDNKPTHTYEDPQEGVTVAYHRDRGEDFDQMSCISLIEFQMHIKGSYGYIFRDGEWLHAPKTKIEDT